MNHIIGMKIAHVNFVVLRCSYQDSHNRAYYMVLAGTRWLGIRLDFLSALLIGAVALFAALYSHNSGKEIICNAHFSFPCIGSRRYSGVARNGRLESHWKVLA